MDFSAAHSGFVIGAYALSAAVLGGLLVFIIWRDRYLRAVASRLEQDRREDRA